MGRPAVAGIEPWHVVELRDMHAKTPGEANNLIRSLSAMIGWAVPRGWRSENPCTRVKKLKIGEGYSPWSWADIEHFRKHAKPHMWWAAALALYTGQRLSDVVAMLWTDIDGGVVRVKQGKTKKRLAIAMHRDLVALLKELPRTSDRVLTNSRGTAWTSDGFKASWQAQLNQPEMAPLRERTSCSTACANRPSCSCSRPAAPTPRSPRSPASRATWSSTTPGEVNQRRLAAAAVLKWEADGGAKAQSAQTA